MLVMCVTCLTDIFRSLEAIGLYPNMGYDHIWVMSDTPPSTGQGVLKRASYVTERHTDRAHIALWAGWHEARCVHWGHNRLCPVD